MLITTGRGSPLLSCVVFLLLQSQVWRKQKRTENPPPAGTVAAGEVQDASPDLALGAGPGIRRIFLTRMCLAAVDYTAADKG